MNNTRTEQLKFFLETKIKGEGVKNSPREEILNFIDSLNDINKEEISAINYYLLENPSVDYMFLEKLLSLKNSADYTSLLISLVFFDTKAFSLIYNSLDNFDKKRLLLLASATNNQEIFNFIVESNPEENEVLIFNKFIDVKESPFINNLKYDKQTILDQTDFLINPKYDFLSAKNLNEAIKLIYPKSGKKLFKLLAPKMCQGKYMDFSYLHFAHYCSVYFDDYNDFQEILEKVPNINSYTDLIPLHFVLEKFPRKTLKEILINSLANEYGDLEILVKDFKMQYEQLLKVCENEYIIDHKKISSIKDLHDIATRDLSLASRHGANFYLGLEFKYPFLRNLKLKKFNNLQIVVPKDNYTLVEWGQKMNNCIGGYSNSVKSGQSIVFALYENQEVRYNIEISTETKKIVQFVSQGNHPVDESMRKNLSQTIHDTLAESLELEIEVDDESKSYRKLFELNNTPVDIKQNILNDIFLINQKTKTLDSGVELADGFSLIEGGVVVLLEDTLTKNKLLKTLISKKDVGFVGLTQIASELKKKSYPKINMENFDQTILEVIKSGVKFVAFDIKSFYKQKPDEEFPQKISESDFETLYRKLREFKDITFINVQQGVKKSKDINYLGKNVSDQYTDQVIFTSQSRVIDSHLKLNVLKNSIGKENYFIKMNN